MGMQGKIRTYSWRWSHYAEGKEEEDTVRHEKTQTRIVANREQVSRNIVAASPSRFDDDVRRCWFLWPMLVVVLG